jgi:plasmid stabilization system protein ParE
MSDDNNIVDLNEILEHKQRQKEIAREREIQELRDTLRYVLLRLEQLGYNPGDDVLPTEEDLRIKSTWLERVMQRLHRLHPKDDD